MKAIDLINVNFLPIIFITPGATTIMITGKINAIAWFLTFIMKKWLTASTAKRHEEAPIVTRM